jgi:hypothetical protein
MLFAQTLASIQPHDKGFCAIIGEDWSQGRATFGGMVAALGNEAMRRLVPADRKLRGLETVFVGPTLAGYRAAAQLWPVVFTALRFPLGRRHAALHRLDFEQVENLRAS